MTHRHLPFTPDWLLWPEPWVLTLLLVLLVPLMWFLWLRTSRRPVIRFSSLAGLRTLGSVWPRRLRLILPILRTVALVCLIVAVARPQRPDESSQVFAEGIAIQMVVDTSSSMLDTDLSPPGERINRLDAVKDVFRRFVEGEGELPGRPNDLIGMIRFARYADSVCPLTLDHEALVEVLDAARTVIWQDRSGRWYGNRDEDGTAIGNALAFAVGRMKDLRRTVGSGERLTISSRVIILLTDGEDNLEEIQRRHGLDESLVSITPVQAGELAATYGIKVYTILAGTGQRAAFGHRFPVDDRDLRRIAEVTGGKHYTARDGQALERVYAEIDELERTKVEERHYVRWGELSRPWLFAAFVCLCAQTFLDATRFRKIP